MLKDITLGQYFPGNSLLHRLDPRTKILLTLLYIVLVFTANSVSAFLFVTLATVALVLCSRISLKILLKSIKPLLIVLIFTAVVNIFWTSGDHLLVELGWIQIYAEGLMLAALMVLRIVALLCGSSVILTYTTSPIALTDGLERLLDPLKKLKLPVHDFAMMMTIALRFIPTLIEETDKIMSAQKARGADFESGSLKERARALIPVLVPLFISSFRRADELATAMECRCYHGGEGRTRMTVTHLAPRDWIMLALFLAAGAVILCLNRFFPLYTI